MADRSLGRSIWNLALALLNATLILAALCLWFAWGALTTAEQVSNQINTAAESVLPMRTEIARLTEEISATRADLATRANTTPNVDTSALQARIAGAEEQLAELTAAVSKLASDPEVLIDSAVASAFEGLGKEVAEAIKSLRGS